MISRALIYPARPRQAASGSGSLNVFCKSSLLLFWGRQGRLCEVRGSAFCEAWVLWFLTYYSGFIVSVEMMYVLGMRMRLRNRKFQESLVMSDVTVGRKG